MGGGLLADATWAIHVNINTISGAPISGIDGDSWLGMFAQRVSGQPMGSVNMVGPLEVEVLYMLVDVISNTDSIGFEVELRRNGTSTAAKISFDPDEIGRKALILKIPFLVNEHIQYRLIKPQNFSIVSFNLFFAGKLS